MVSKRIVLNTKSDISDFVNCLGEDGDEYVIIDPVSRYRVAAKSLIGVIYAWSEWDEMRLVNETRDGHFPAVIEKYCI